MRMSILQIPLAAECNAMQGGAEEICLSSELTTSTARVKFYVKTNAGLCIRGSVFPLFNRFGRALGQHRISDGDGNRLHRATRRNHLVQSNCAANVGAFQLRWILRFYLVDELSGIFFGALTFSLLSRHPRR